MMDVRRSGDAGSLLENPHWVNSLFGSSNLAWLWLMVRIWLGMNWLAAGWHKTREAAWTSGLAVKGYWERVVVIPEQGRPLIAYDWYRDFLEFLLHNELHGVFGPLVAWGEVLVGIALIGGALTGIAAFFGAVMNWSFMLAGTASTNPILGIVSIGVIVAWKTAGWWGADRFLLPYMGAPWKPGALFSGDRVTVGDTAAGSAGWRLEQWVRMLVAAAVAVIALSKLDGGLQILAFGLAVLLAGTAGSGVLFFSKR